ncbi:MAG: C25 family cysteine peptidase, partial [Candidatus Contubernalis sp.]|nr:C25 family cysteine peptidase [Candidatus Contubernalis sp.]
MNRKKCGLFLIGLVFVFLLKPSFSFSAELSFGSVGDLLAVPSAGLKKGISAQEYAPEASSLSVSKSISVNKYDCRLEKISGYDSLKIKDATSLSNPGEPNLPATVTVYTFPINVEILSVNAVGGRFVPILNKLRIAPAPQPTRYGEAAQSYKGGLIRDEAIYSSENSFPGKFFTYETGRDNQNTYLYLRFFPVQYTPKTGDAFLITDISFNIYYKEEQQNISALSAPSYGTDYEVLIIAPSKYITRVDPLVKSPVENLQDLHNGNGTRTCYVSTEAIYNAYGNTNQPPAAEDPPFAGYKDGLDAYGKTWIKGYNYNLAKRIIAFLRHVNGQVPYALGLLEPHPLNVEAKFTQLILFGNSQDIPPSYYAYFQEEWNKGDVYNAWVPTDFFYSSPDYDWVPNLAVGRLPIKNTAPEITGTIIADGVRQFKTDGSVTFPYWGAVYGGTCTGATQESFTDNNAAGDLGWVPEELKGAILYFPGSVGGVTGRTYTISDNNEHTLYFSSGTTLVSNGVAPGNSYQIRDRRSHILVNVTSGDDDWTLNEYQNYSLTITTSLVYNTKVEYNIDYHRLKVALATGTFILRGDQAWDDQVIPGLPFTVSWGLAAAVDTVEKIDKWNTKTKQSGTWDWFKNVAVAGGEPFGNSF